MEQLKQAMRDKNEVGLRTLRAIKAALLEAKTAVNAKAELTEADELKLLQKMAKQRKDSLTIFKEQNREDLAQKEADELKVLDTFLPAPLSDGALSEQVAAIIKELGASGPADIGKVMAKASKQLAGQADGAKIAEQVKAQLASQAQ
jgi:uncharacterized protein YqeY